MKQTYKKIAVIGGGIMGTVLVRALAKTSSVKNIFVCESNTIRHKELTGINPRVHATANLEDCADAEVIFLAVKPQDFHSIDLTIKKKALVCSIMAGVSISKMRNQLKVSKVVRMMPNLAARVDTGFTAWTATTSVNFPEKKWIENFLSKIGDQLYVKKEEQIDKATAVTGSGPAYIFNMLSIFIEATKQLGFKEEEARRMILQVLRGVNALADKDTDFTELTRQVTSKGGTTEAALWVFEEANLKETWAKAVIAAYKRAEELSGK